MLTTSTFLTFLLWREITTFPQTSTLYNLKVYVEPAQGESCHCVLKLKVLNRKTYYSLLALVNR